MRTRLRLLAALGALIVSSATFASGPAAATPGEVRKIDLAKATVTLKHGRIENLDMPGMTMPFVAADPKLLNGLKVGDKVRFAAEDRAGVLTVTRIEPAK